jgi:hypothetical protein
MQISHPFLNHSLVYSWGCGIVDSVRNISCIGVFSSLILGLWCKCIEVGFEIQSDVFYSRAVAISVERSSQKKSISGLKSSERAV